MRDLPLPPSRLIKALAAGTRGLLWLLVVAWLLLAVVWGAIHGWIVPRIDEFRPTLEIQASRALGVPVRIGEVVATTQGLIPSFELKEVVLQGPDGQEALRLPKVQASLSPRSLLNLGFEQLYIDQPELDIRRDRDGRIFIAGLDVSKGTRRDGQVVDWFFSQMEFVIHQGTVRWTDETREAAPLALSRVDLVVRNTLRRHDMRLDATPPAEWGQRFSLVGQFRQPLLLARRGQWQNWVGQVYGRFDQVDVSRLRRHADLGLEVDQGRGGLRFWVDVHRAAVTGVTVDLALAEVQARLAPALEPLVLRSVYGRIGGRRFQSGYEFQTQGMQFDTREGVHWPGGNVFVSYTDEVGTAPAHGELRADRLDLGALGQIATRLPLGQAVHQALYNHAPQGLVDKVQARWQTSQGQLKTYELKGQVSGLSWAARPVSVTGAAGSPRVEAARGVGVPGVKGLSLSFDLNQAGGKASVALLQGSLDFPGVWDEPVVMLDRLSGEVQWQITADRYALQWQQLKFAGPDLEGESQGQWHTASGGNRPRFPGVLDLQASLRRADGTRVHRYLPASLPKPVRDYVREAVLKGEVGATRIRIKGDLRDFPFNQSRQGEFLISARLHDVHYAFAPRSVLPAEAPDWFALTQLSGELVFDRAAMHLRDVKAGFSSMPGVSLVAGQASIPDLGHNTTVLAQIEARGALPEMLAMVNATSIGRWLGQSLAGTVSNGVADYRVKLSLPILKMDRSTVQGSVTLLGNDLQFAQGGPPLSRVKGVVNFSETGFTLAGVQAGMLGGDARLEGGYKLSVQDPPLMLKAQGTATAEGLRQARELGLVSRLAQRAQGSAPYLASLSVRDGAPELSVTSSLQGLAIDLPEPLAKSSETSLPLRYENSLVRQVALDGARRTGGVRQDQVLLELGGLASAAWIRDLSGTQPQVIRGGVALGLLPGDSYPSPASGVTANIKVGNLDLDAWDAVLTELSGQAAGAMLQGHGPAAGYLPQALALRAQTLRLEGRELHDVVLGGTREDATWRVTVSARELNGHLAYQPAQAAQGARLFARLARLDLPQAAAQEVEHLLDRPPTLMPNLDVVVDQFELRGKQLGRLELEALNRAAADGQTEWRLNKLNLTVPEAMLSARGHWASLGARGGRRTVMTFHLDIADAGDLLARLGQKDVLRRGKGRMEGQVSWRGSPLALDHGSLSGHLDLQVDNGQFLKADPGFAKLLGVLNLQALPRRLTLDFRDVFSEGFAFDFIRGDVQIEQGVAATNNLQMKGVNAAVLMEGRADIARETQDIRAIVVPEVNAGTAALVATAINPAVGLGTFVAQFFLRKPLTQAATDEFHIDGTWTDPRVTRVVRRPVTATESDPANPIPPRE